MIDLILKSCSWSAAGARSWDSPSSELLKAIQGCVFFFKPMFYFFFLSCCSVLFSFLVQQLRHRILYSRCLVSSSFIASCLARVLATDCGKLAEQAPFGSPQTGAFRVFPTQAGAVTPLSEGPPEGFWAWVRCFWREATGLGQLHLDDMTIESIDIIRYL